MRKKCFLLATSLLTLMLYACGGQEPTYYNVAASGEAREWQVKSVALEEQPEEEVAEEEPPKPVKSTGVQPRVEEDYGLAMEAKIFSVAKVDGESETTEGGVELYLERDNEYVVKSQILLTPEGTGEQAREMRLKAVFPMTLCVDTQSALSTIVGFDAYDYNADAQAIASTMYDLALEYVDGSSEIEADGRTTLLNDDVAIEYLRDEDGEIGATKLTCTVPITREITGVEEYIFSYRVRTTVLDQQIAEAQRHKDNPIKLEIQGVVGLDFDAFEGEVDLADSGYISERASQVMAECLKVNYMLPKEIGANNEEMYVVAKVTLPEWATAYVKREGMKIFWSVRVGQRGTFEWLVNAQLDGCHEKYGTAEDRVEIGLEENPEKTWSNVVTLPVTVWQDGESDEISDLVRIGPAKGLWITDFDLVTQDNDMREVSILGLHQTDEVIKGMKAGDNELYFVAGVMNWPNAELENTE